MRGLALVYTVLLECLLLLGSSQALKVRGKEVQLLSAAALTSSAVLETQRADAALQVATLGDFGVDNSNELEVSGAFDASSQLPQWLTAWQLRVKAARDVPTHQGHATPICNPGFVLPRVMLQHRRACQSNSVPCCGVWACRWPT